MIVKSSAEPRHAAAGHRRSKIGAVLAACAGLIVLAACQFVGSGTLVSETGHGRATFTFDLNCPTNGTPTGVLTYVDPQAGVEFHGVVPGLTKAANCSGSSSDTATVTETISIQNKPAIVGLGWGTFTGTYNPLNSTLTSGTFQVTVAEGGTNSDEPGFFCIALYGGAYNDYSNAGTIQWGNIVETNS